MLLPTYSRGDWRGIVIVADAIASMATVASGRGERERKWFEIDVCVCFSDFSGGVGGIWVKLRYRLVQF